MPGTRDRSPSAYSGRQNPALQCLQIEVARAEMGVLLLIAGGSVGSTSRRIPPENVE
jgi:hypothetical protein